MNAKDFFSLLSHTPFAIRLVLLFSIFLPSLPPQTFNPLSFSQIFHAGEEEKKKQVVKKAGITAFLPVKIKGELVYGESSSFQILFSPNLRGRKTSRDNSATCFFRYLIIFTGNEDLHSK